MTGFEILMACVGFVLCAVIFALIGILMAGVIWWTFKQETEDEYFNENDYEYED